MTWTLFKWKLQMTFKKGSLEIELDNVPDPNNQYDLQNVPECL